MNQAEAGFWIKSEGYRMGWSDEIIMFHYGGQQWVSETLFPAGTSVPELDNSPSSPSLIKVIFRTFHLKIMFQ